MCEGVCGFGGMGWEGRSLEVEMEQATLFWMYESIGVHATAARDYDFSQATHFESPMVAQLRRIIAPYHRRRGSSRAARLCQRFAAAWMHWPRAYPCGRR